MTCGFSHLHSPRYFLDLAFYGRSSVISRRICDVLLNMFCFSLCNQQQQNASEFKMYHVFIKPMPCKVQRLSKAIQAGHLLGTLDVP